eukprot:g65619.t1
MSLDAPLLGVRREGVSGGLLAPLRVAGGVLGIGLTAMATWMATKGTAVLDGVRSSKTLHDRDGYLSPSGLPGPLQMIMPGRLTTACLFTYLVDTDQDPTFNQGAVSSETAYLYGARHTFLDRLAVPTGSSADVIKGRLQCWQPMVFASKLHDMEAFWGYGEKWSTIDRGVAQLVDSHGQAKAGYWFFEGSGGVSSGGAYEGPRNQRAQDAQSASGAGQHSLRGALLGMGNPLLDMSADVPLSFLKKYDVKPREAMLATEKQMPLYKELEDMHDVSYIAGGATQNSIRVAQWMLGRDERP